MLGDPGRSEQLGLQCGEVECCGWALAPEEPVDKVPRVRAGLAGLGVPPVAQRLFRDVGLGRAGGQAGSLRGGGTVLSGAVELGFDLAAPGGELPRMSSAARWGLRLLVSRGGSRGPLRGLGDRCVSRRNPAPVQRMQTSHGYRCMVVGKDPRRLPPRRGSDGSLLHLRPAAGRVAAGVTEDALDPERRCRAFPPNIKSRAGPSTRRGRVLLATTLLTDVVRGRG